MRPNKKGWQMTGRCHGRTGSWRDCQPQRRAADRDLGVGCTRQLVSEQELLVSPELVPLCYALICIPRSKRSIRVSVNLNWSKQ